jgi:hypothetical protein
LQYQHLFSALKLHFEHIGATPLALPRQREKGEGVMLIIKFHLEICNLLIELLYRTKGIPNFIQAYII